MSHYQNFDCLTDLADRFGTPLYVIDERLLAEAGRNFQSAFRSSELRSEVFFSVKTNPVPIVVKTLADEGIGAEVRSTHEFRLAREVGVPGDRIVVNGPVKSDDLLEMAVSEGAAMINAESVGELERLALIGERLQRQPRVGLRVNPSLRTRWWDFTLSTSAASSPLGFQIDSPEWIEALGFLKRSHLLRFVGLHCHIGTGIRSDAPYRQAIARLLQVWRTIWNDGHRPSVLDIGGGFNVPSLKELTLFDAFRQFAWNRAAKWPPQTPIRSLLDSVAESCRKQFSSLDDAGLPAPVLYLEPGRALSATSQILLLRVQRLVERHDGPTWAFCDGGAMSLSPLLLGEYHEIRVAGRTGSEDLHSYTLLGSMPTPLDIVAVDRKLPALREGDVIVVRDVGAYFTSLSNTFAGSRPAIAMVNGDSVWLARNRETFEDLFESGYAEPHRS